MPGCSKGCGGELAGCGLDGTSGGCGCVHGRRDLEARSSGACSERLLPALSTGHVRAPRRT